MFLTVPPFPAGKGDAHEQAFRTQGFPDVRCCPEHTRITLSAPVRFGRLGGSADAFQYEASQASGDIPGKNCPDPYGSRRATDVNRFEICP